MGVVFFCLDNSWFFSNLAIQFLYPEYLSNLVFLIVIIFILEYAQFNTIIWKQCMKKNKLNRLPVENIICPVHFWDFLRISHQPDFGYHQISRR